MKEYSLQTEAVEITIEIINWGSFFKWWHDAYEVPRAK